MTLHRSIIKLHATSVYKITIINRDGNPLQWFYWFLLYKRKDLLNLDIDGIIDYKVGKKGITERHKHSIGLESLKQ